MQKVKPPKFNFEAMKAEAMSPDPAIRKKTFIEYFERFEEFPSYLFDNSEAIDSRLSETMQELLKDPGTSQAMHKGITALMMRMPSTDERR